MKRNVISVLAILVLATMFGARPSSAQSGEAIAVSVPFEFTVGKTMLPAGKYSVRIGPASSGVLTIQGLDCGRSVFILTNSTYANQAMNESQLVFNRYGNQYFLSKVWTAGTDIGCELHKTPAEREITRAYRLAKSEGQVETVTIAAERH